MRKPYTVEAIRIQYRRAAVRRIYAPLSQREIDERTPKFDPKVTERRLISSAVLGRDDDIPRRDLGADLEVTRS